MIGQSSKHVIQSINTLMWLAEINVIQYSLDMASEVGRDFKFVLPQFVVRNRNWRYGGH